MPPNKVVLLACGSYNPPTNMHLRMFELARDHLHRMGSHLVVGGLISPVHDAYAKNDLVSAIHRKEMVRLALRGNNWIKLSDWECNQESWCRTRQVLNYHQNHINEIFQASIKDDNSNQNEDTNWFPDNIKNGHNPGSIGVVLLCGADLLESFGTPGLWADEDIEAIVGRYGLVVITRSKTDPSEFIYNSDLLTKYMSKIIIVREWICNEVSSTKVRRALRRNESVKYLIPDAVIDYIRDKGLYGCTQNKYSMNVSKHPKISALEAIMTSSPLSNCMNICNNNMFKEGSYSNEIDAAENAKTKHHKFPGQAVKVRTETIIAENKVVDRKVGKKGNLRSSKSSSDFRSMKKDSTHKSAESLDECKSCDENLVKFIFSKHGIQIISDVETIV